MEIIVSGRHFEISESLKKYVEDAVNNAFADMPLKMTSARVVLDVQKKRTKAEILVNMKGHSVEADVETFEMYNAIDEAVVKAATQARKHLEKHQHNKNGEKLTDIPVPEPEEA